MTTARTVKAAPKPVSKAEAARRNQWAGSGIGIGKSIHQNGAPLPGLIKERQREFEARLTRVQAPSSQVRMCNATMPGSYRTGDGDVRQAERPGSGVAYGLPSRGTGT